MSGELSAGGPAGSLDSLSFLPRPIRDPGSAWQSIAVAWATAFFPSIILSAIVAALLPSADQPQFNMTGPFAIFAIVVFAPVLETLIMGTVLLVLLRFVPPAAAVVMSAVGWGVAHSMAAPIWGLIIWWPFLVLSALFVAWRERSVLGAYAIAALVHGLHNLPTGLLVASGKTF